MVKVRPFKAYLANQKNIKKIICPEYDTINTDEARVICGDNEMCFIHCNKPEIDLAKDINPYDDSVYIQGRNALQNFIKKGYLVQDEVATLYIYQQTSKEHSQKGIVGLASIQDYEENRIKKHEYTLAKKEEDRTKLTDIQNANAGPVFLAFRENQEVITAKINSISQGKPYGDVTCDDGVRHVLWRCTTKDSEWFQKEFDKIPNLYICDGHHRTASAYNVGKQRRERYLKSGKPYTGEEPFNYFMTLFYPANNLAIMDYNRLLKSLNGMTSKQFIDKVSVHFDVKELPKGADTKPGAIHKFSLHIDHKWYSMVLKPESLNTKTPITQLDSQILTDLIFEPILEIMDLKKDSRIDFCGGIRGHKELERRCNVDCVAAIAMHPCSLNELMNVADANMIMPPKSTWFEPKPRAGYIVRVFEDDSVSSSVAGQVSSQVISQQVIDARARLAQKYTSGTQIGGKGTQRRTKKVVAHQHVEADKKLVATVKKFGVQSLTDIDECNMFKDDNTILNFKKPTIQFSVKENLLIVTGNSDVKLLQDMLPEIIKQVGPQQYEALKNMMGDLNKKTQSTEDDDEDDVPPLVSGTFEDASKK